MSGPATYDVVSYAARRFGETLAPGRQRWNTRCPLHCPPDSGGTDRFVIYADGGYWCSKCGAKGWLDEIDRNWRPDPNRQTLMVDRIKEEEDKQQLSLLRWQAAHQVNPPWQQWHENMPDSKWAAWMEMGIPEDAIAGYTLGWNPARRLLDKDQHKLELPAFTIPIAAPANCQIINVQARIEDPVPDSVGGKYRQEATIPAAAFYANKLKSGVLWMVEGAKKAIILAYEFEMQMQVVGLPSKVPHSRLLETAASFDYEQIILALDPNSQEASKRAAKILGERCRLLYLPAKPDDLITQYNWTKEKFLGYMRYARKGGSL